MKYTVIIFMFLFAGLGAHAQKTSWGVKGGLNYNLSEMGIDNAYNSVGDIFEGEQANNGWHLGLVSRSFLSETFFVQFQGLYSKTSNTVSGKNALNVDLTNEFNNEAAQFDILGGLELFNFLRLQGGLIGRLSLNNEYKETFGTFNVGYSLGTGVSLGRFNFDIAYNTSFDDHHGEWQGIPLSHNHSELLFSAGIMF